MEVARKDPILGKNFPGDRTCTRMIVGGKCGKPGVYHIVWKDQRASVACVECGNDVLERYAYVEVHDLTMACTSPSGMWFPGEGCRFPETDDDYRRGRYLVGY